MKLKKILPISFFVVSLVVSVVLVIYSSRHHTKDLTEKAKDHLRDIVEIYARQVDFFLEEQKEKIVFIANLNTLEHNKVSSENVNEK